jgi:hypothetical protein
MSERLGIFLSGVLLGLMIAGLIIAEIITDYPELLR